MDDDYPEVKVRTRDGNMVEGFDVPIDQSNEKFNEYTLNDGTVLRAKLVVTAVVKVKNQWDQDGNPVYTVQHQTIVRVAQAHPGSKRKG